MATPLDRTKLIKNETGPVGREEDLLDRSTITPVTDKAIVNTSMSTDRNVTGDTTDLTKTPIRNEPTQVSGNKTQPGGRPYITEPILDDTWGIAPPTGGSTTPVKPTTPPVTNTPDAGGSTGGSTGGTSGSGSSASVGQDNDVRKTIEGMLQDPNKYLTDQSLRQEYTEQQIQDDEIMDPTANLLGQGAEGTAVTTGKPGSLTAGQVTAADDVKVKDFEAALIDVGSLKKAVDEIAKLDPMKAASMSEHMDKLLGDLESGNVPLWARPAVAKVEQMLAARGLSASSIGRDSLFNAIIQSAMPIAQQDAAFEQEAYKTNYNAKVQAVLSDVNMEFAAKQFNANSVNQTNQFKAQLQVQVDLQNAARKDAMSQFNVQTQMQADQFNISTDMQSQQFNATQVNAMTQMNVQLQAQREQFNAQMSSQIEQSNVNWRRQVNQMNTAGVNAVNQANVQNAFNLSNQALTFLWQEMRDQAHWSFQATESEKDRKAQLEATLLANETAMGGEIGKTIENLLNGSKLLDGLFSMWGK